MRKSKDIYYFILMLTATAAILAVRIIVLLCAVILFGVWWALYYNRLSYSVMQDRLVIKSGVFFRKLRVVKLENIQWVMRLKLPMRRAASLTALHTLNGIIVILSDFSTKS